MKVLLIDTEIAYCANWKQLDYATLFNKDKKAGEKSEGRRDNNTYVIVTRRARCAP
jgi:hypothetical protein